METQASLDVELALPWATRATGAEGPRMSYRQWDGGEPATRDDCGIPCPDGREAQPDVVLLPCIGFTSDGYRLGYGGGYFDRYLERHPHVTAIGVAWENSLIDDPRFSAEDHDQPMMLIVTEQGILGASG